MDQTTVSTIGSVFALVASLAVTIEYLVLVKLRGNRGAQNFFALLVTLDAILVLNAARIFLGDYPLRIPLITAGFYVFGFALVAIGVSLWRSTTDGARAARTARLKKKKENRP